MLAAFMAFTACDTGNTESGGDAITISSAADLDYVRNDLTASYILTADIDLSGFSAGEGWVPIGDDTNGFTGTFNGNGHKIRNLSINRPGSDYQGLFGYIGSGGNVKNLTLTGGTVTGNATIGALAGFVAGASSDDEGARPGEGGGVELPAAEVTGCSSSVTVSGMSEGFTLCGGLIGLNNGILTDCYATADVTGGQYCGGLIGTNGGQVSRCYATGDIMGTTASWTSCGGLIGQSWGTVTDCYATGSVTGNIYIGGLVGYASSGGSQISNCYATGIATGLSVPEETSIGGLIGCSDITPSSSYYFQDSRNFIGTKVSEADMKDAGSYTGWDFTGTWGISSTINNGFPYLRSLVQ